MCCAGAAATAAGAGGWHMGLAQVLGDRALVELLSLALYDRDSVLRALAQAVPEAVAEGIRHELRLPADDLDRALLAGWHAQSAAVAFLFVDLDDLPQGLRRHGPSPQSPERAPVSSSSQRLAAICAIVRAPRPASSSSCTRSQVGRRGQWPERGQTPRPITQRFT